LYAGGNSFFNASYFPCPSQVRAVYKRSSFSPCVIVYPIGKSEPCALIKLSCKLRANLDVLEIQDPGNGAKRLPVRDVSLGEVLSSNILKLSQLASEAMNPASGFVLDNFTLAKGAWKFEQFEKMPETCVHKNSKGGTALIGHIQRWVSGLRGLAKQNLQKLDFRSRVALASTVILDAMTLNSDRGTTNNVFVDKKGAIMPLDFEKWLQESPKPIFCAGPDKVKFDKAVVQATEKPRCLKGQVVGVSLIYEVGFKITSEMCRSSNQECKLSVDELANNFLKDPYFAYVTSEHREMSHTMCCNGYNGGPKHRACKACRLYSRFSEIFQKPLDESCHSQFASMSVIEVLAAIVLDRLKLVHSTFATQTLPTTTPTAYGQ